MVKQNIKKLKYHEGKAVYVSEAGLYSLIMSSQAPFAKEFRKLVCKVILPSIRKYGSYQIEQKLSIQLAIKDQELEKERKAKEQAEQDKEEAEQAKNHYRDKLRSETERHREIMRRTLEFNQATKKVEPTEYIYVATTEHYQSSQKFKVGGCQSFELLKSRLTQYNSGESDSDAHFFIFVRKTLNYRAIEQNIQSALIGFRENANKEVYYIHFSWLEMILDKLMDGNDGFLEFVNDNRAKVLEDTINKEPLIKPPVHLEQIKMTYIKIGETPVELSPILNEDLIDAIKSSIESFSPDNNTVRRKEFEAHLIKEYPELKINNKKRPVWEVVQKIGTKINPMWRYRY